jgi:CheY-like chemotaxis protein
MIIDKYRSHPSASMEQCLTVATGKVQCRPDRRAPSGLVPARVRAPMELQGPRNYSRLCAQPEKPTDSLKRCEEGAPMKTVLIAEDDAIFLARLQRMLSRYSDRFDVAAATNGKEAIAVLQQRPVSVLVTDIQMPEMDGLELLTYVNEHHPVIPCFVMTAFDTPELKKKVAKDIIYFFSKPFEIDSLGAAIVKVIERDIPRGAVTGISVASFLQMIVLEKKTCLFEVLFGEGRKGIFYFENGVLFDAGFEGKKGEEAARELIDIGSASFRFRDFPSKSISRRIETDVGVLIDLARSQEDESAIADALDDLDFDIDDLD